jgi:hypothetical protein
VEQWLGEVERYCPQRVLVALVGNKADQPRVVAKAAAAGLSKSTGRKFNTYECSALSGEGVEDCMQAVAKMLASRG